jgi:putative flippase GtrA
MPAKKKSAKSPAQKMGAKETPAAVVKQGAKFGVVGISNTIIDFTLFQLVSTLLSVPLNLSFVVKFFSGSVAMVNSFYWNRRWTFKSHSGIGRSGVRFVLATLVSIWAIQPAMVYLFSGTTPGISFSAFWYDVASSMHIVQLAPTTLTLPFVVKTVAFGMGVIGSAIWNFTLYKLWAFKED